jgi:hypothetical protein
MNNTPLKYDRDAQWLPDKHGNPIRVGDFVRRDDGTVWEVEELRPQQEHEPDNYAKKTGNMDLMYSGLNLVRRGGDHIVSFASTMNVEATTQSGASIGNVEKVDMTAEEICDIRLREIDATLTNIDRIVGELNARRLQYERKRQELLS